MNKRIDQIADQVMYEFHNVFDSMKSDGASIPDEFFERFTELIVLECAQIVAENSLPDAYSEPCLALIAEEIKEHFGVEP